ncbi:hypothetical protein ACOJQI_21170 [Bacillus salacetis]|uniref:hypothetical protein n=1 Tax=Bacillus salacetis TaxID=2315464 RepID=UPI003B9DDCC2
MSKKFQDMPKTIQKTVRYIYQDAPMEKLEEIHRVIERAIKERLQENKETN